MTRVTRPAGDQERRLTLNAAYTGRADIGHWGAQPPGSLAPGASAELTGYSDGPIGDFYLTATYHLPPRGHAGTGSFESTMEHVSVTPAPDTDERAALQHFLDANRAAALAVLDGLSEQDAQRSVVPSGWTPFDLAVHLGGVERHWFAYALDGDAAHTPVRDGDPETLAEAVELFRAEVQRSDQIVSRLSLDDPLALQPEELVGEVTTVRGVLLHVIEEIARHAGHLDIARELLDGRTGLGPR